MLSRYGGGQSFEMLFNWNINMCRMRRKTIKIPIYKGLLDICITDSQKEINQIYSTYLGDNIYEDDEKIFAYMVRCKERNDNIPLRRELVVFNVNHIYDKVTNGTIAHEAFHLTNSILASAGVMFEVDNDEPFTYLLGWIVDEIHLFFKEQNITI